MNTREILQAYKQGQLTTDDVRRMLQEQRTSVQPFPLSEGQRGLWMLQKLSPGMTAYNVPLCFRVKGTLEVPTFEKALQRLLAEHPLLTAAIVEENGVPFCRISPHALCPFEWKNISGMREADLLEVVREEAQRPFVLQHGPPIRVRVYSWDANNHVLQIVVHHIVFDGRSVPILLQSLWQSYSHLLGEPGLPQASLAASYRDFVEQEQHYLAGADAAEDRAFWSRQLAAPLPILELPQDFAMKNFRQFEGRVIDHRIGEEMAARIQSFCQQQQVTGAVLFLSVLQILLLQYTRQDEFVVGIPMMGRPEPRFEDLIGYFVNMIPLRTRLRTGESFAALLDDVQTGLADAFDHSSYPFARMVRDLKLTPSQHSPVFQVAFEYQNARLLALADCFWASDELPALELMKGVYQHGESDLGLEIAERHDGFELRLKYNPSLYAAQTFERILSHYCFLLGRALDRPECPLSEFPLLSTFESETILHKWNATELAYPSDKPVHALFSECARQRPDAPAVWFGERFLTYGELDEKSGRLASYLQSKGAGPGACIGVCLKRSHEIHVALLGVNKAGAAYVPLDPQYPADRLRYMTEDSGVTLLLTQRELLPSLESVIGTAIEPIVLDSDWPEIEKSSPAIPPVEGFVTSNHLAYVMYTSGSTGKPKGVMIPNRGLTNVLWGLATSKPGMTSADRLLAVTTICFDVAGADLYLPLITGAQCFFCSGEDVHNAERLMAEIRRIQPTVLQATPATWKMLFDAGWKNEEKVAIWTAGEAIPEPLRERFERYGCEVWNLYGPTEASIYVTGERIDPSAPITIGRPLANCKAYVLDQYLRLLPAGVAGELCVGGHGLALGYLNRPELTAEKFVDDPFRPGEKLYRTGDLARWLTDGRIDYLGRMDAQVKLRGHRIELGEIEYRLSQHPDIQSCAVVVRERGESRELAAFFVLKQDVQESDDDPRILSSQSWRKYLRQILPEVMIPAIYVAVRTIPTTPSGKIDRKVLAAMEFISPMPKRPRPAEANVGGIPAIESKVLAIWKGVLQSPEISIEEGFFDVGGDSILAVTVTERIKAEFGVAFAVIDLFAQPTVKGIAQLIASRTTPDHRMELQESEESRSGHGAVPALQVCGSSYPDYYRRSIAIIGISCQIPGASSYRQFWSNLRNGVESVEILKPEQLREMGVPEWIIADPRYIPARSAMAGKDLFDADFFKVPPRDAELMDPQLRLLLENAWQAVEDAGYVTKDIPDTAVFMSASNNGYPWTAGGNNQSYLGWVLAQSGSIPTIISHKLGLKGPSYFIHSNCSSSLVGLDAAYRLLLDGEVKCALVGGATVFSMPSLGYFCQEGMHFSADGHVHAFDGAASGMVSAEGVAVVLVKPALAAIEDGDHIYALVRGVSVNNDGAEKAGYYAPGVRGQAEVVSKALHKAGVDPATIGYLEAHGTGTHLGDPIEFAALQEAFAAAADGISGKGAAAAKQFCGLGSVKTNVGHLDTAAGLAGCIKAALSLLNGEIPPTLNFSSPNRNIDPANSPFYIADKLHEWKRRDLPRRAGVSSFGIGGTNAHAILEEFVAPERPREEAECLVPVSARDIEALLRYVEQLRVFLGEPSHFQEVAPGTWLADLAFTLQLGRQPMACRAAFLARDCGELIRGMSAFLDGKTPESSGLKWKSSAEQSSGSAAFLGNVETLVESCIVSRNLDKLASLWSHGCAIDWSQLHVGAPRRRLSLPTYPFTRKRYWRSEWPLGKDSQTGSSTVAESEVSQTPNVPRQAQKQEPIVAEEADQVLLFEELWQEQPAPAPNLDLKKLLCFVPDGAWTERFLNIAEEVVPGASWILVRPGGGYERRSPAEFIVDQTAASDYRKLFEEVKTKHGDLDGVLYLWPLQDGCFVTQCHPIIHILQALAGSGVRCPRILLAGVFEDVIERCYLDSWVGFGRSLRATGLHAKLAVAMQSGRCERSQAEQIDPFVRSILAELRSPGLESVLYEGGRRFVCRVHPLTCGDSKSVLRNAGTYLITGGAGSLGSILARHLAERYSAKLVLTGRTPLDDSIRNKIAALENAGAEAIYVQADVCDLEQMRQVVDQARQRFGVIHGVLHTAGVVAGASLLQSTPEEFDQVTGPKIQGTLVLEQVLPARDLDFVCYFSSTAAILGDFGSCEYSVANRFQSAFAAASPVENRVAIGWPMWQEGGMGLHDEAGELYLKTSGQKPLPTAAGLTALEDLLARPGVRPAVFYGKNSRICRFFQQSPKTVDASAVASGPGRQASMRGWPVQECVAWDLRRLAAGLLKVDASMLHFDVNLGDFGFDSIGLADYAASLSAYYGIKITPGVFFSHPVLRRLAEYMVSEYGAITEEFYREGVDAAPAAPERVSAMPITTPKITVGHVRQSVPLAMQAIAIVGMSGRFPQAENVEEMWRILEEGREAVSEIPLEKFDWRPYYGEGESRSQSKWMGVMPSVAEFDPLFFEISPREAEGMDPRQRLLLQEGWKALEDAGYGKSRLDGQKVGMFVGVEQGDYQFVAGGQIGGTGNHDAMMAARLAYVLNLRGPALVINTACSSGLVALHQACLSLRAGECEAAVVGAANVVTTAQSYVAMTQSGLLSPEGKIYAFDRRANGIVPGEAVVALVVKPLERAEAEGDPIYAVIRGSGINYDGRTNGITAPSGEAQKELLQQVYAQAGVKANEIEYVVTHGTGTRLGDPVEINALRDVFHQAGARAESCALTSNKTNFGHTFAASGLVSVVNLVEAMRKETIPASLNCEQENEYIEWEGSPLYVNREARRWKGEEGRRVGAVSSFGISGTNAHVVMENWRGERMETSEGEPGAAGGWMLLACSGKTEAAVKEKAAELEELLSERSWKAAELRAMSRTLLAGRQHFGYRCALVVKDGEQARELSGCVRRGESRPNLQMGQVARGFTGQKALQQYVEELLEKAGEGGGEESRESLQALAELYCQGYNPDWERLFRHHRPRCISLPAYPFARERYWAAPENTALVSQMPQAALHPLVHQNTSTLSEQRFTSTFTGQEPFFQGASAYGKSVFAEIFFLEMARAAITLASTGSVNANGDLAQIRLQGLKWPLQLTAATAPARLEITIAPYDDCLSFWIYPSVAPADVSDAQSCDGDSRAHYCEGAALLGVAWDASQVDVSSLESMADVRWTGPEFYDQLRGGPGAGHASSHVIQDAFCGLDRSGRRFICAKFELPEASTSESSGLPVRFLQGIWHACLCLCSSRSAAGELGISKLEAMEARLPLPRKVQVVAVESQSGRASSTVEIEVFDSEGIVCFRAEGLQLEASTTKPQEQDAYKYLLPLESEAGDRDGEMLWSCTLECPALLSNAIASLEPRPFEVDSSPEIAAAAQSLEMSMARLLAAGLRRLGVPLGSNLYFEDWKRAGLLPEYERWLQHSVRVLEQYALATSESGATILRESSQTEWQESWHAWENAKHAWLAHPEMVAQVTLVEATLRALPEILTGKAEATEILFHDAGMEQVAGTYKENPVSDYYNGILADCVAAYCKQCRQSGSERLRILEIGAGTGGTSTVLFKKLATLQPAIEEYCFSDISKAFLLRAEQEYGPTVPYLSCKLFDVERPLIRQSLVAGSFDVVVASSVLHATRDIRATVRNAKAALKRKGLLVLNEIVGQSLFAHLTFGLLEGWWRFSDSELRVAGCPALLPETWKEILIAEGFRAVAFPAEQAHTCGQQIVVAESDGRVLQPAKVARGHQVSGSAKAPLFTSAVASAIASFDRSPALSDDSDRLIANTRTALVNAVAAQMKLRVESVDVDAGLSEFGCDSIALTVLSKKLNQMFDLELTPAVFFEYATIRELSRHLVELYPSKVAEKLNVVEGSAERLQKIEVPESARSPKPRARQASYRPLGKKAVSSSERHDQEPIAIIGMAARFPLAENLSAFWNNLEQGKDCITEIPADRWDWRVLPGDLAAFKWGAFIDGVSEFDPLFFGISPRDAEVMDPQQRLLMTYVWKVMEDAGYSAQSLSGSNTAIIVATAGSGYDTLYAHSAVPIENVNFTGVMASIGPNRISHFLNLHGPSEPVETTCSSSLVAIHRGIQAIRNDQCEMAIVGGVNTIVTPTAHFSVARAGMLSPDGRCKTFSSKADGYVRGEGVGMLMLKRLSQAERDGDNIQAVILSTAENHGGRANSLTAPNAQAQAELLKKAYFRAGIDPRTVGYVEAHGTGTALGDPVEINALKSAFRDLYQSVGQARADSRHCGIGAVKTNIGHLELAAGIAGVIKVVLQLQHRKLAKSLHCEELNPYVQLEESPFYIVRETVPWPAQKDSRDREIPRRAGVSSFGAGGVNVHVVLEEYASQRTRVSQLRNHRMPALVLISAKNDERLREHATQMVNYLASRTLTDEDLSRLAFTLQVGRDAMDKRLALACNSGAELQEKLEHFLAGEEAVPSVYRGDTKVSRQTIAALESDEDVAALMDGWIAKGKFEKILDLWSKGLKIDWTRLYGEGTPGRISLPTYPFARERYWITIRKPELSSVAVVASGLLHPLLHRNTSSLSGQRYTSHFTGHEPAFVNSPGALAPTLPALSLLEMARAAVIDASGISEKEREHRAVRICKVAFLEPVEAAEELCLHVAVVSQAEDRVAFEIYSEPEGPESECTVHCEGEAVLENTTSGKVDLASLRAMPGNGMTVVSLSGSVLALDCPECWLGIDLTTSLSKACTSAAMQGGVPRDFGLALETLDECLLLQPVPANAVAVLYQAHAGSAIQSLEIDLMEIDLCDQDGNLCARFRGMRWASSESRLHKAPALIGNSLDSVALQSSNTTEVMSFEEFWEECELTTGAAIQPGPVVCFLSDPEAQRAFETEILRLAPQLRLIFVAQGAQYEWVSPAGFNVSRSSAEDFRTLLSSITQEHKAIAGLFYLWPLEDKDCIVDYQTLLYLIQATVTTQLRCPRTLLAGRFQNALERCYLDSWIGFEKSLQKIVAEPALAVVMESLDAAEGPAAISGAESIGSAKWARRLWAELGSQLVESARYEGEKRYVRRVRPLVLGNLRTPLRSGGVYLITGGAGGLGRIFADHLIDNFDAKVVVTGRSPRPDLQETHPSLFYLQADVCNPDEMREVLRQTAERFGPIQGVIHGAGVDGRGGILTKSLEDFDAVLAPKVKGALALEEAIKGHEVDFICYFSSSSAILGDFGSCDYSAANRFPWAYAQHAGENLSSPRRVAIAWPLWRRGSMGIEEGEGRDLYLKASGLRTLEAEEGLRVFEQSLASQSVPKNQSILVMAGVAARIARALGLDSTPSPAASRSEQSGGPVRGRRPEMEGWTFEQCVLWDVTRIASSLVKLPPERLSPQENLAEFGLDSLGLADFAKALGRHYEVVFSPSVFFSYPTLEKVAGYFASQYPSILEKLYPVLTSFAMGAQRRNAKSSRLSPPRSTTRRARIGRSPQSRASERYTDSVGPKPIAIVGMSGRFPQAENVEEMWRILEEGREAVSEIPLEKFDWRPYYGEGESRSQSKWMGVMPSVAEFDPLFFEISPREAEGMDPRQRLLLQEGWKALEDAGYGKSRLDGQKVGMFVGVEQGDYQFVAGGQIGGTGNHDAMMAARLAYVLNLRGPALVINTACSSGLVALHQACLSLRAGECEAAVVGAANVVTTAQSYVAMTQSGLLSPEGKIYAFDRRANGIVPGEAVVALVVKPLERAEAEGDPIYAVIRGSGINYDGRTNGITAPSGEAQKELLQQVYAQAGVKANEIEYVVTHGTGTRLGDPVEINALRDVFHQAGARAESCALTSNKTNFGHTFAASGLVSVVNLVEAMRKETIPASLNCEQENEYIEWEGSPLYVNREARRWKGEEGRRVGAVSSFGISGTNAHVVMENWRGERMETSEGESGAAGGWMLLACSGKTEAAVKEKAAELEELLSERSWKAAELRAMSRTLLAGRQHFGYRCALVVKDGEQARELSGCVRRGESRPNLQVGQVARGFTGQKALQQYVEELLEKAGEGGGEESRESLQALAELYCQGYNPDWERLFRHHRPRCISLPAYPFARERYWFSEPEVTNLVSSAPDHARAVPRERRFLRKTWQLAPTAADASELPKKAVILLASSSSRKLAERLAARFSCARILDIAELSRLEPSKQTRSSEAWIDLVGCGDIKHEGLDWIPLLQQQIEACSQRSLTVLGVTRGLESFENSNVNLAGALGAGLYRMLQSEYSRVRSRHLDLDPHADLDSEVEQIVAELSIHNDDAEVCYRRGTRYCASLREVDVPANPGVHLRFHPEHVLLVTGGTRGLGYLCARHFVREHGVKRVVLMGREGLPPRNQWDALRSSQEPRARKIVNVEALEAEGAEVSVAAVSVDDSEELRSSIASIRNTHGRIGGIVHCAGMAEEDSPAFVEKQLERMVKVLAPKVGGLNTLLECLRGEPLKFFVLFSSVSAIVPRLAVGQSVYAMANAYMDYAAEAFAAEYPMLSMQWPSWNDTGMGAAKTPRYFETGLLTLSDAEGLDLLNHAVAARPASVLLPAVVDPTLWNSEALLQRRSSESRPAQGVQVRARDEEMQPSVLSATRVWLQELILERLKMDPEKFDPETPLQEYGVDSIMLVQFLRPIQTLLEESLDPSVIYEYPSIGAFAEWLVNKYGTKLSNKLAMSSSEIHRTNEGLPVVVASSSNGHPAERTIVAVPQSSSDSRLAVVGLACRFPGANNVEEYWNLLSSGRASIGKLRSDRWSQSTEQYAGLLDHISQFDPAYFGIPESDARLMDPQALMLLEEVLNLIHHAGYVPRDLKGERVGVYLGARTQRLPDESLLPSAQVPVRVTGQNYMAANVSQFFDLRGASVVVDTACSSTLVAMNMAIQDLRSGDVRAAIVGGVHLFLNDAPFRLFAGRGILKNDARFHVFDGRANGAVLAEGIGMALLKTLDQARADGDRIYAVVNSIAINNDGRTAGPAAPNFHAQKDVMLAALAKSGLRPEQISHVEVNGSGSVVNDLLELKAIESVYRADASLPCELGSMKPNIGHPLTAEGIASFIKLVLMLHRRQRVPFLSAEVPMEHYDFSRSPFRFSRAATPWEEGRIAALNCFGDGGTNAHIILEGHDSLTNTDGRSPIEPPPLCRIDLRQEQIAEPISTDSSEGTPWDELSCSADAPSAAEYETVWEQG